ncbi:hypothetical protein FE783_29540 [Paenibacillus mesophilus]|uniref:hypothetical protein n=1 Tax=Paenibacillus mesophilus TaxID=2582849 RepID=UPI00110DDDDC|nr:hypothetical protein [Paenibacillus mesophilus]TMV45241.1 hypothetical protein FE783_29540 [Paenibacillus mesophilus]
MDQFQQLQRQPARMIGCRCSSNGSLVKHILNLFVVHIYRYTDIVNGCYVTGQEVLTIQRRKLFRVAKLLLISILAIILLVSSDKRFPYPELLSKQKGKYYILYVGVIENNRMRNPDLFTKVSGKEVTGAKLMWSLESAQKEYPKLELHNAPVYVIFGTKRMLLKTEIEKQAMDFLLNGSR